ncbi:MULTISPECIES: AAA family ATPase [Bacteria]|uniref:AAA family ATPase n=1 Tax=Bacteria TaxID=2 RepID=UPI003C7E046B
MRLHRLEVEGFGPFRERQTVDFDAFADEGIFLIAGRTGAGKSSILDAVCFGLYGGVPRYDGGERRLRSDHCEPGDPSEVVVEFSTAAGRFRVTRSPEYERPAKRGGGTTKQAAAASLEELVDGRWVGRSARAVDVAHDLDEILQLNQAQFLQVILLAQNRFAEFLHASSKDRQALLRRLFGTERFGQYQARFEERRRASELALGGALAAVTARVEEGERLVLAHDLGPASAGDAGGGDGANGAEPGSLGGPGSPGGPEDTGESTGTTRDRDAGRAADESVGARIDELRRALDRAAYRSERRAADRDAADAVLREAERRRDEAREQRQAQAERDRARAALAELDDAAPAVADDARALDRARAAEVLRPVLSAERRAVDDLSRAEAAAEEAEAAWSALASAHGVQDVDAGSAAVLRTWTSARVRETGAWERAAALESDAASRRAALGAARAEAEAAEEAVVAVDQERSGIPERREALVAAREEARRIADRRADLARARDEAEARLAGTQEVERAEAEQLAAERELLERSEKATAAQTRVTELRRRRLAGIAGELAAALVPGEPCAVCGATAHPRPAVHADPVLADDVAAAEAEQERTAEEQRVASARASEVGAGLAAARVRAGGLTVAAARAAWEEATAAHAAATAAAEEAERLDVSLAELLAVEERLDREQSAAADRSAAAREALLLQEQAAREADELVAAARGEHESVAERIAVSTALAAAAETLAAALDERGHRREAVARAVDDAENALAGSPFDDPSEAESAMLDEAGQRRLEERIRQHAAARDKERAVLLDLELRMLPEEPIAVEPFDAAAESARADWVRAVDEASRAQAVTSQLRELIEAAASEHERSAAQAEEHETLRALADALAGRGANSYKMNLETFVLAAELEDIVEAANVRLGDMSSGRYRLVHSDALAARGAASGLGIVVFDAFTGQTRPAQSLSGGETFLGSLALALGLAEVVTARAGGVRLDTLFIDEGFGSLDGDTLEVAMRTLDELRQGGRTVGVISHVEAMQEQIPAQLTVRATPQGPSVIDAALSA